MLRHHRPSVHDQRHARSILPPRGSLDDLTRDHCVTADRGAGKTAILSDSYIWNMRTKWIRYRTYLFSSFHGTDFQQQQQVLNTDSLNFQLHWPCQLSISSAVVEAPKPHLLRKHGKPREELITEPVGHLI